MLELTEWPQAREILRGFVFYEFLEPYLPMWFEKTLHEYEAGTADKADELGSIAQPDV